MICREMLNRQSFDWLSNLVCQERQKQDQAIAVTALGILPEIPISLQMFEQEPSDPGTEKSIVSHDLSPSVERIVQIARLPDEASLASWSNNAVLPRCERDRGRWIVVEVIAAHLRPRDTRR